MRRLAAVLLPALALACTNAPPRTRVPDWLAERLKDPPALQPRTSGGAPAAGSTVAVLRGSGEGSADGAVRAQLQRARVHGLRVADEESLRRVVDLVRAQTGLPLVVAPAAENAALDAGVVFDLDLPHALSATSALNLICDLAGPGVAWTVRHGTVLVTTAEKARGELLFRSYDVRLLTMAQTDFRAPQLGLGLLEDQDEEDYGGVAGPAQRISDDELLTLIQDHVAAGTWNDDGVSVGLQNGVLFVRHTPAVHVEVLKLLAALGG